MKIRIWAVALASATVGLFAGVGTMVWVNSGPSVVIESVDETDAIVSPGDDTISFVVSGERSKSCPIQVSRYLWRNVNYRGRPVKEFRAIDNPPLTPVPGKGHFQYMLTLTIPKGFPPGQWYERTITMEHCGWLTEIQPPRQSPDRPVTIEAQ
jgi:hypothetical protein